MRNYLLKYNLHYSHRNSLSLMSLLKQYQHQRLPDLSLYCQFYILLKHHHMISMMLHYASIHTVHQLKEVYQRRLLSLLLSILV